MTRLKRVNGRGTSHRYVLDDTPATGVTTALKLGLPAPALVGWGINSVADYVLANWAELEAMGPSDKLKAMKRSPYAHRDRAALRGTEIHGHGEALTHGRPVDVPDELRGPVEAYARFLDEWGIEPIATETVLGHTDYGYAGTADLWCVVAARDGARCLVDIKTGKGVYPEAVLQLAAYRYANLWQPDGPDSESAEVPEVDRVYVAHVLPDAVRMVPVAADEAAFRAFLYVLQTARWATRHSEAHRQEDGHYAVDFPLIGEAESA